MGALPPLGSSCWSAGVEWPAAHRYHHQSFHASADDKVPAAAGSITSGTRALVPCHCDRIVHHHSCRRHCRRRVPRHRTLCSSGGGALRCCGSSGATSCCSRAATRPAEAAACADQLRGPLRRPVRLPFTHETRTLALVQLNNRYRWRFPHSKVSQARSDLHATAASVAPDRRHSLVDRTAQRLRCGAGCRWPPVR